VGKRQNIKDRGKTLVERERAIEAEKRNRGERWRCRGRGRRESEGEDKGKNGEKVTDGKRHSEKGRGEGTEETRQR
jgi:hypothetical protein